VHSQGCEYVVAVQGLPRERGVRARGQMENRVDVEPLPRDGAANFVSLRCDVYLEMQLPAESSRGRAAIYRN
jgi:hypothetical protein